MLESDYREKLRLLLSKIEMRVAVPKEFETVLANRGAVKVQSDDRRRFVRRNYPVKAILELPQTVENIPREHEFHVVITKDFSRSGISFFHADQLYPGERPMLWLVAGKFACNVVRCIRQNERCYEIGATFVMQESERRA